MSWKLILRLGELTVTIVLATSLFLAWRAERTDRAKLTDQLAAAQQSLTQAPDRQRSRDADLRRTLASLAEQKRSIQTPEQVVKALAQQIPLPQPIQLAPAIPPTAETSATTNTSTADSQQENASANPSTAKPAAPQPQAVIPSSDLKPLYDFALDCKACQAKLAVAQSDLTDEHSKTAALTKERDAAVQTAKGGSTLRRFARAAKWLLIGAVAGALTARAAR
jgi:hypothetical protein